MNKTISYIGLTVIIIFALLGDAIYNLIFNF